MLSLLDRADALVCNWRPEVAERLGLGDAMLAERNPGLVRAYVSGYGPDGPLSEEPAFDTVIQGRAGMTYALARDGEPVLAGGYPVDKLTSVMVTQAVLAALVARQGTGRGERIDLAMLDAIAYLNFPDLFVNRIFVGEHDPDPQNRHALTLRPMPTKDGWMVVAPASAAAIRGACEALGRPEWADDLLGQSDHNAMVRLLFDRMEEVTRTETTHTWLERFRVNDVAAAPCLTMDEHIHDAQVVHNGLYEIGEEPVGVVRSAGYPAVFGSWGRLRSGGAPLLGSDTEAVLGTHGLASSN